MIVGSLCTGYGGLETGLRMVFPLARLAWVAENDKAASVLLEARYPGVPNLGDIKAVDWSTVERVDVLAAGIPCQPHSFAGKGRGSDDERDLVGAFIEAVRALRPKLVILENVPGFKRWGLPRVLGALAELGFHVRWHSVRASEAGASHRRERVFVMAWPADAGSEGPQGAGHEGAAWDSALAHAQDDGQQRGGLARLWRPGPPDGGEVSPDAHGVGCLSRWQAGERSSERQRPGGRDEALADAHNAERGGQPGEQSWGSAVARCCDQTVPDAYSGGGPGGGRRADPEIGRARSC